MIKKFLPFEELVYHSELNKEELLARLDNEIEAEKSFGFGAKSFSYSKPYIGKIAYDRFEIKRAINYRNSFLPVIKGTIKNDLNGSKINVKMNLIDFVKVFMIVWLGGVSLGCIASTYSLFFRNNTNSETGFFMFVPFIMLVFGIAMGSLGFKAESKKSIADLEELLQAKIIQNNNSN